MPTNIVSRHFDADSFRDQLFALSSLISDEPIDVHRVAIWSFVVIAEIGAVLVRLLSGAAFKLLPDLLWRGQTADEECVLLVQRIINRI